MTTMKTLMSAVLLTAGANCVMAQQPILTGFHADPEVLYSTKTKKYYIYSTTDGTPGWGGHDFSVFSSKNLVDWNLLKKVGDRYEETSQMLDASEIPPISLRQIRREYIQHAIGAVESMPKNERFAAFTTLAMSESSYNYAVEVLEEARKKIIAKAANDSNVERVYEMMLVAFPMSKKIEKEAK